jgi:hypothetical protein
MSVWTYPISVRLRLESHTKLKNERSRDLRDSIAVIAHRFRRRSLFPIASFDLHERKLAEEDQHVSRSSDSRDEKRHPCIVIKKDLGVDKPRSRLPVVWVHLSIQLVLRKYPAEIRLVEHLSSGLPLHEKINNPAD